MPKVRNVNVLLGMIERGAVARDIDRRFAELLHGLNDLGSEESKKEFRGTLTIKVSVGVKEGTARISAEVDHKLPKRTPSQTLLFVDDEGELDTEHPKQPDMFGSGPRAVETA
jgi:hypothetical protein